MSVSIPPNPNVSTFNNLYWITSDTPLTESIANKLYLKFPVAQGTENLQTTNVQGALTCNSTADFNNVANFDSTADFNDVATFNDDVNITTGKDLILLDNQAIPTSSLLRQDTGTLTISNNAFNGAINLDTTNGSGATTTSLQLNKTKGATFTTNTYVEDSVFVLRDNDTTTTQVNMSYAAGQQFNFNLAPSTLNPTTTFQSYLDPAGSVISPLTISNTGITLAGTAPITFPDSKVQNSAFTGGAAGTYTNTNMTIDANGKISAISSGSAGATPTLSAVLVAGNTAGSTSINMNNNAITGVNNLTLQTGSITYPDTKVQNSAFTGGTAGTYTNTNMTIDANGKISAISSGSAGTTQNLASVLATTPNAGYGGNLPMTGLSSITMTTTTSPVIFGSISRAVQSSDYNNVAVAAVSMETLTQYVDGGADNITLTMTLQQNYTNTANYIVFPSVYWGYTGGSSGTYTASGTANALNTMIIYDRNNLNFKFYCSKSTGDNVSIYITFLVIYNGGGSNYPAAYNFP